MRRKRDPNVWAKESEMDVMTAIKEWCQYMGSKVPGKWNKNQKKKKPNRQDRKICANKKQALDLCLRVNVDMLLYRIFKSRLELYKVSF